MAVPNLPFMLSQANTEFKGNGWGSDIRTKARLPAAGWLSELAGKSSVTMLARMPSFVHNNVNPYIRYIYSPSTNVTTLLTNTPNSMPLNLFSGPAWIRIRNGGVNYENCQEARWFQADGTQRGVLLASSVIGTTRSMSIDFSGSNGGPIIYSVNTVLSVT